MTRPAIAAVAAAAATTTTTTTIDDDDDDVEASATTATNVAVASFSSSSFSDVDRIDLRALLSTCVDASARGCDVIRSVRETTTRRRKASSSCSAVDDDDGVGVGVGVGVKYKVEGDVRSALTEADVSSQEVIVRCLRSKWGDRLRIVGEEDDASATASSSAPPASSFAPPASSSSAADDGPSDPFAKYSIDDPSVRPLDESHVPSPSSSSSSSSRLVVKTSDVVVFVDPLDGTREYVEGRIRNVRCLVGICVRGAPTAGVVAVPFAAEERSVDVYYGLVGGGGGGSGDGVEEGGSSSSFGKVSIDASSTVDLPKDETAPVVVASAAPAGDDDDGNDDEKAVKKPRLEDSVTVLTGDSRNSALLLAVRRLETLLKESSVPYGRVVAGGCGNKMMRIATRAGGGGGGGGAIAVMGPGTSSWDTAAPTAVLYAAAAASAGGGTDDGDAKVTDFFGNELTYDGANVGNDDGVVASKGLKDEGLHQRLCRALEADGDTRKLLKEWKEQRP